MGCPRAFYLGYLHEYRNADMEKYDGKADRKP